MTTNDEASTLQHPLVIAAKAFATREHASIYQKRKYTGEDYIVHPAEVVSIVATRPHTVEMLAAAWLHDTVEDVPRVSVAMICDEFGGIVGSLVCELTDVSKPSDGDRAARKALDLAHTAQASADAKTIKCADLISNTTSILRHDPDFAKVYMREKERLLNVLTGADPVLLERAWGIVRDYFSSR